MSSQSKKTDKIDTIDHTLGGMDTELDIDLSDSNSKDTDTDIPDIQLNIDIPEGETTDFIYAGSKDLVKRPGSDVTIRSNKHNLSRMANNQLLDAHDYQEKRIVHPEMDKYEILNAYREIRTKIIQKSAGKNQVIMVVSLQHGMGTTFTTINLAAAFSYEGEKTSLIVDCDQRKKKLDKIFPQNANVGLTDYLEESSLGMENIIFQTGVPRMRYIPVGNRRENKGEYFSSERMRSFIMQIKRRYSDRYIILNAPPIEVTADAAILSEVTDYIVFVLPYGKVTNQRLKKALKLLPREKVIGFVMNDKIKYV